MSAPTVSTTPKGAARTLLKATKRWGEAGFKVDEFQLYLYSSEKMWHTAEACPEAKLQNENLDTTATPGLSEPQKLKSQISGLPPRAKVITLKELSALMSSGLVCQRCDYVISFKSSLPMFITSKSPLVTRGFASINYLVEQICLAQKLKLKTNSVRAVGRALPLRRAAIDALLLLSTNADLPGAQEVSSNLKSQLDLFEDQMKDFRDSPEGLCQIQKYAGESVFLVEDAMFSLPKKSKAGKNGQKLLKEAKEMKKSLRKSIKRLNDASIYSLCSAPRLSGMLLDYDDGQSDEDGSLSSALQRLISDKWLNKDEHLVVMPYVIAYYLKDQGERRGFEVIHLDQEPSERLMECVKAFYPARGGELSLLEAYKAAVAID